MAEDKKSFLLYVDMIHTVRKMPPDKAGELFLTILSYVNDENPEPNDLLVEIAFEPIKQQLKRDLKKWEDFRVKQSDNGKLGGRPKKPSIEKENPKNPSLLDESQKSLNVNVNVNDTVNVNDNVNVSNPAQFPIFESEFILTEPEIQAAKEINHRQTGQLPTEKDIGNWLYIFKQVNFTGQKFYENRTEIVKHFKNWVKSQKLQNGTNQNNNANGNRSTKKGTSDARIERAKTW
jgi:hypothetical protein